MASYKPDFLYTLLSMIFSLLKVVCPANIGHVNKPKPFRMLAAQTTLYMLKATPERQIC